MAVTIIAILLYTPWWGFAGVVVLAAMIGAREYLRMARPDASGGDLALFVIACLLGVSHPILTRLWPEMLPSSPLVYLAVAFLILAGTRLARPLPIETAFSRLSLDVCGLVYLAATFPFILLMRFEPDGGWLVLLSMVVTFGSDTGAYFSGRFLGRHKLYPDVSPNKTIEGAVGGMLTAVGLTFVMATYVPSLTNLTTVDCIILGVVGSALAITGDLVESLMKRSFDVKDSGDLIPGHGGILDRIDALLFCGPFVWMYWEHCVK